MIHIMKTEKENFIWKKWIALLLVLTLMLTGCGNTAVTTTMATEDQALTFGLEPVFEYSLPEEMPNIYIDMAGYLTESAKIAIFHGEEENMPQTYEIKDRWTREVVYRGTLQTKSEDSQHMHYGVFSDFKIPGEYYIECEKLGCSEYFSIGDDVYHETCLMIKDKIRQAKMEQSTEEKAYLVNGWKFDERGNRDTRTACETLSYLMLGYEIYPDLFHQLWSTDEDAQSNSGIVGEEAFFQEIRYEMDWLLSMQDGESGGIYAGVRNRSESMEIEATDTTEGLILREISEDATACFAAVMAKYGYLYQKIDKNYATTCLKAASKAWKYLEMQQSVVDLTAQMFYASAELYRASNDSQYHRYILQHQNEILTAEDAFSLLMGEITYLSTRRKVDKDLCGKMMDDLMKRAEKISTTSRQGHYFIESAAQDQVLDALTVMSVVDYVITNYEYYTVIENHIHYLLGRNSEGVNMVEQMNLLDMAKMLMYISSITAEKKLILND